MFLIDWGSLAPSFPCHSCARASAKVTARIVKMFQEGEIESGLAMQLLGGALAKDGGHGCSKKRPLDGNASHDDSKAAKTGEDMSDADADGPSVEELLDQATKVKKEPKLISNVFGTYFGIVWYIYAHV